MERTVDLPPVGRSIPGEVFRAVSGKEARSPRAPAAARTSILGRRPVAHNDGRGASRDRERKECDESTRRTDAAGYPSDDGGRAKRHPRRARLQERRLRLLRRVGEAPPIRGVWREGDQCQRHRARARTPGDAGPVCELPYRHHRRLRTRRSCTGQRGAPLDRDTSCSDRAGGAGNAGRFTRDGDRRSRRSVRGPARPANRRRDAIRAIPQGLKMRHRAR